MLIIGEELPNQIGQRRIKILEVHTYNTTDFERGDNGFIDEEIKPKGIVIL